MKSLIQAGLRRFGFEIARFPRGPREEPAVERGLRQVCAGIDRPMLFDVGAHHGSTETLFRRLSPAATIHCFEPFAASYAVLARSISPGSVAHNFGFADSAGTKSLAANVLEATNSLLSLDETAADTWALSDLRETDRIDCQFRTIDAFIAAEGIERIDLLKLDTQGAEYLVLEGARQALADGKIKAVFLEIITAQTYVGQKDFTFYIELFDRAGFTLYGLYETLHTAKGELLQLDALFVLK